jgi:centrosomal protein CEP104
LAQLDVAKRQAVNMEDYDKAKEMKDEMDDLRGEIEHMVREIHIPGITDNRSIPQYSKSHNTPRREDQNNFSPQPIRAARSNAPPVMNVDDMPVGPGANTNINEDRSYEDDVVSRPIKPKASISYAEDEEVTNLNYSSNDQDIETFPPGSHPLEGIQNLSELPNPEVITGKSKDTAEQLGITPLIGEYRTRCLFSKVWALREAAVSKVKLMLADEFETSPGLNDCVKGVAGVLRVGIEDKFSQVFFGSLALLEDFLVVLKKIRVQKSIFVTLADQIIANLINSLFVVFNFD